MKNRVSFGKLSFREIARKSNRRLGKSDKDSAMGLVDWIILIVLFVLIKLKPIPESVPHAEWISLLVAFFILFVLLFVKFRRQAPRTCWRNATWSTAMWASVMTVVPILLYWLDEFTDIKTVYQVVAASSVLWVACLGCYLRLRYIRRRSQEIVMRLRMERKRSRNLKI